jgi:cytochrome b561
MKAFPPPRAAFVYTSRPARASLADGGTHLCRAAARVSVSLLPRGGTRSEILFLHKSTGMTVLCLVALRIVWRVIVGAPAYAVPLGRLTHAAARSAHIALCALMVAMPVSGFVLSTAGIFSFPVLLPKDPGMRAEESWANFLFAWAIGFVLAAHLGTVSGTRLSSATPC